MFKKIDQFMAWAMSDAPGIVRVIAWPLFLPLSVLFIAGVWLLLSSEEFDKWRSKL